MDIQEVTIDDDYDDDGSDDGDNEFDFLNTSTAIQPISRKNQPHIFLFTLHISPTSTKTKNEIKQTSNHAHTKKTLCQVTVHWVELSTSKPSKLSESITINRMITQFQYPV